MIKFKAHFLPSDLGNHFKNNIDFVYLLTQAFLVKCRLGAIETICLFYRSKEYGNVNESRAVVPRSGQSQIRPKQKEVGREKERL